MTAVSVPHRQIRANYDEDSLVVYQAFSSRIAEEAVASGGFGPSFSRSRMTWIKPSFRWMLYRCGFATKPGQEHVLAIRISRSGFEWALRNASLSHYDRDVHADRQAWADSKHRPVRIQWDPERDLHLRPLEHRSLQAGLSGPAAAAYCDTWIREIRDVTALARDIHFTLREGRLEAAQALLPAERPYPLPEDIATIVGATRGPSG
jgi:hypothetical protein